MSTHYHVFPNRFRAVLLAALLMFIPVWAADADPRIEALEQEIEELRALIETDPDGRLDELERRLMQLAEQVADLKAGDTAPAGSEPVSSGGLGPAASKVYGVGRGVSLGGYGEMLYENYDSTDEDGSPVSTRDQLDFLRAIIYVGYKFNDRILFNSEIEFEHATTGGSGEVSVEFAYLDFLVRESFNVRAGMVLMPVGFVNELHEPPVFLGARRPYVEQRLLPTTWRENGAGFYGEHGQLSYRAYMTTNLAAVDGVSGGASGFSSSGVRGGRSKGSKSSAEDLAFSGRLDWQPGHGILLGASFVSGNTGQSAVTPGGESIDGRTTMFDIHAQYHRNGIQARALFVDTEIEDVALINEFQGFTGSDSVGESQSGWYGELGYDLLASRTGSRRSLIPYLRYESYDTQEAVPAGFSRNPASEVTVTTVGMAWKPIPQVVLKADWNEISNEAGTGVDQINVALGFLF